MFPTAWSFPNAIVFEDLWEMPMKLPEISFCFILAVLWLPAVGLAGNAANQSTGAQGTQSQSGSTASQEKAAKDPSNGDVRSRGLLQKKKKKQKGGSAGHSQPSELSEPGR